MNSEMDFKVGNRVVEEKTIVKNKKVQGFLPRELLLFLGLDHLFIESYLED